MIRRFLVTATMAGTASLQLSAQTASVNVGDASIHYELSGRGRTVVLIHGWAQDLTIWDDQVMALSPRYRVLRYDRRSYGSSTGHADPTADPDDLRILLDSLKIPSAIVLGLSAGARTALNFAVAFPERVSALVLYGSGPPAGFQPMAPEPGSNPRFDIAKNYGLDSLRKWVEGTGFHWEPPNNPGYRRRVDRMWSRYDGRDLLDRRPPSGRIPVAGMNDLAKIRVPTLIVVGDHERPLLRLVADTLTQRIPDARQVVIAEAGHGIHFAQPERFNAALLEFLDSVARASESPRAPK
ncbi:MAG TPA: alpha/beta hydrolase [Gemmatimonadaceae bacterium]|nr:alpha/beta hydrolase [Gemmatimonadaceae bacterium]